MDSPGSVFFLTFLSGVARPFIHSEGPFPMVANGSWDPMIVPDGSGRRRFLKKTLMGLLALSFARVAFSSPPQRAEGALSKNSLRFLSPQQFRALEAFCDRMVPAAEDAPGAADLSVAARLDLYLSTMDRGVAEQIAQLLDVFEWSPMVFDFKPARFTSLTLAHRDEVLRAWATSRLEFRRVGFQALRRLSMAAYYSQEGSWKAIGYDGPYG
jgi:Gluconate 2-dehydrogenase subunit 3